MLQAFPPSLVSFPLARYSLEQSTIFPRNEPLRPFPSSLLLAALWQGRDTDSSAPDPPSTLYLPVSQPTGRKRSFSDGSTPQATLLAKRCRTDTSPSCPSTPLPKSPDILSSPTPRTLPPNLTVLASCIPPPLTRFAENNVQQDPFSWPPVHKIGLDPEEEALMPDKKEEEAAEDEDQVKALDGVRVLRGALC